MYRQSKSKKVLNIRPFIAGGAAVLVVLISLLLILNAPKEIMVERGELTYSGNFSCIIMRDEKVFETENYEKAVFIAAEGEKIKKGGDIAKVYKWGYNDSILNQLLELQNNIKQYQENEILKDINNKDLTEYNDKISEKTAEIQKVISGDKEGDIITLERELKDLMAKRKNYLDNEAVKADDKLKQLYAEEDNLLKRIEEWQVNITAESDGIISFYFDGNEQYMNIQNMDKLNKKNIDEVLKGQTSKLVTNNKAARSLYRLVNAKKWYVILYADNKVPEFKKGTKYTLTFKDIYDKKYTGKLLEERKDTRGYIYTFLMTDDVSALLRVRRIDMTIKNTFSGIKIPQSALKEKDGTYGVYVREGSISKFEPVNVLIRKDNQAVVTPMDANSTLKENATVEY